MDDDDDLPDGEAGPSAGWLATFADLMSLLMCFFVLLLSFAEMDAAKFKRLAGSMKTAFGVQREIPVVNIPKGTSVVAKEFSPSKPEETVIHQIWQKTEDNQKESLQVLSQETGSSNSGDTGNAQAQLVVDKIQDLVGETEQDAMEIAQALHKEIREGEVEVETSGYQIVIRLKESGTFDSGSADLKPEFRPVLDIIHRALEETPGTYRIEGHTDDVPIATARFRSNWDLSSARAVSVAHALFEDGKLSEKKFMVSGLADTKPLESNESGEGRARNRRVEVVIDKIRDLKTGPERDMADAGAAGTGDSDEAAREIAARRLDRLELPPEEIF